jgi:hypothetical protein
MVISQACIVLKVYTGTSQGVNKETSQHTNMNLIVLTVKGTDLRLVRISPTDRSVGIGDIYLKCANRGRFGNLNRKLRHLEGFYA